MKRSSVVLVLALELIIISASRGQTHPAIQTYTGAATCAQCHGREFDAEEIAGEFTQSVHFAFKSELTPGYIFDDQGNAVEGVYGKANRYCGLPGSITAINWIGIIQANNPNTNGGIGSGCATCHTGNGTLPLSQLNGEDAWRMIDCMICHAADYRLNGQPLVNASERRPIPDANQPTGFSLPLPSGEDLAITSRSIRREVTRDACQRCHLYAGGGYINKRGHDFDRDDVHSNHLSCTDCHHADHHKIAMGRQKTGIWANELLGEEVNELVGCAVCHAEGDQGPIPEHNGIPANHFNRLDCQSCHIPTVKGLEEKWFNRLRRVNNDAGRFLQWTFAGRKIADNAPVAPKYFWFNGTVRDDIHPLGDKDDETAKIHPFRIIRSVVPVDEETGITLPLKLGMVFGADSALTAVQGDTLALIDRSIRTGVSQAAVAMPQQFRGLVDDSLRYTGNYNWETEEMVFSVDHGVKAAEEALTCADCHAVQDGRMDWEALGYDSNPYPMSIKKVDDNLPKKFGIIQVFPNPFNGSTRLSFTVGAPSHAMLTIMDGNGREVTRHNYGAVGSGVYTIEFNGGSLPSGVYFARLTAGSLQDVVKLNLVR